MDGEPDFTCGHNWLTSALDYIGLPFSGICVCKYTQLLCARSYWALFKNNLFNIKKH
jgi:hypothetical protein